MIHKMAMSGGQYDCSDHIKSEENWWSIAGFIRCFSDLVQGSGIVGERLGGDHALVEKSATEQSLFHRIGSV
jgi:hypothetical protein